MYGFEKQPLRTAVLFLVFNRPDTTRQVFEQIRKAKRIGYNNVEKRLFTQG